MIELRASTPLDFEDLCHWYARSASLLGRPVTITQVLEPIVFNKNDWTGLTGTIRPTGENTFTIDDIDGEWKMTQSSLWPHAVTMTDGGAHTYRGFWHFGKVYFCEFGSEWEDNDDARIAFAQMMHNI